MRAPLWLMVLLLLVVVGVGVYGYFTTPLPFGLSSVVRTPGGSIANTSPAAPPPSGNRTAAGQPLSLGTTTVLIVAAQRNQDLSAGGRGPAGVFTVLQIQIQNEGNESLTPQSSDFHLVDDRGRVYAVDMEATRALNASTKRRMILDSSVPPGVRTDTMLAFETASDANALTLRVKLGYGEVELPR